MGAAPLDHLRAFHRRLVVLAEAGVPLDLGESSDAPARVLDQIESRLATRVGLGQPLDQALQSEHDLPPSYRCAALTLLAADDEVEALNAVARHAGDAGRLRSSLARALATPAILVLLGYAGLICLCRFTAPAFEALYDQIELAPSGGVRVLSWLREWLPVWAPLAPVGLLIGAWAVCRVDWIRRLRRAPAMRGYATAAGRAAFADQLARLSKHKLPLAAAGPLADDSTHARGSGEAFLAALDAPADASDTDPRANPLPPLLRWSLSEQQGTDQKATDQRTKNLRFTADAYRRDATRRAAYWRLMGPTLLSAAIGGGVLLAYGYALFHPFASLVQDIAHPSAYPELPASSYTHAGGETR